MALVSGNQAKLREDSFGSHARIPGGVQETGPPSSAHTKKLFVQNRGKKSGTASLSTNIDTHIPETKKKKQWGQATTATVAAVVRNL
jgi:hypothetical protein